MSEAIDFLRTGETDYKITKDKLQSAVRSLNKFITAAKIPEEQFAGDDSPLLPELQKKLQMVEAKREAVSQTRAKLDEQYPEIASLSYEDALAFLRGKLNAYTVAEGQMKTADKSFKRFITESGATTQGLALPESPKAAVIAAAQQATSEKLDQYLRSANVLLAELDLDTDLDHIVCTSEEKYSAFSVEILPHKQRMCYPQVVWSKMCNYFFFPTQTKVTAKHIPMLKPNRSPTTMLCIATPKQAPTPIPTHKPLMIFDILSFFICFSRLF